MKILMITSEIAPFVKVGGLADVAGALPAELSRLGHDVRIVCPLYGSIKKDASWIPYDHPLGAQLGGEDYFCRLWEAPLPGEQGATAYFLEHIDFFGPSEVYAGPWGEENNEKRFTFLCRASLNLCYYLGWIPDVIHCHDWPTALLPVFLNTNDKHTLLGKAATVLTIHNLEHQGHFSPEIIKFAQLPVQVFREDCLESSGGVNLLKGGLYNATRLTTVSPSYAREIQTPDKGFGLDHVLRHRADDLIGILNGIDTHTWNPQGDPLLPATYSARNLSGKAACKAALQNRLDITPLPDIPILGVVSRLWHQKGLDLLAAILPNLLREFDFQIAIIGAGDPELEKAFTQLANRFTAKVGVFIGYDEALAHLIIAGADFFIMPSRFEPCGLSQLYAMNYGTPPIVRATGGLADTVEPFRKNTGEGSGFVFEEIGREALLKTIVEALSLYTDSPEDLQKLRANGMREDFSWKKSASAYQHVYQEAVEARAALFP